MAIDAAMTSTSLSRLLCCCPYGPSGPAKVIAFPARFLGFSLISILRRSGPHRIRETTGVAPGATRVVTGRLDDHSTAHDAR